jgi:hypothetical protein
MKGKFLILLMTLALSTKAQKNFQWEIFDTVQKSKDQLFADTKMFIAQVYNEPEFVIKHEDKENGIILVRAVKRRYHGARLDYLRFDFGYDIIFSIKDNRVRVKIINVYNKSIHTSKLYEYRPIDVSENFPGWGKCFLRQEKYFEIMFDLKYELNQIIVLYKDYLRNNKNNDW